MTVEMLKTSLALIGSLASAAAFVALLDACSSSEESAAVVVEAGVDAAKRVPPSIADAQADAACDPNELPGFVSPKWTPPAPFGLDACTSAAVETIIGCYFDAKADEEACDAFLNDAANADCVACLITESTASELGPVVLTTTSGYMNVAGCIANIQGDRSAAGCAAKYQAASTCQEESCAQNCSGTGDVAVAALEACAAKAATGVCAAFSGPAKCADALIAPGGAAEKCTRGHDFSKDGVTLGMLFCTARPRDGGTDAPSDG